ncbi:hypothetical protein CLOM_g22031 [Closterium sp. NIES-68]|nr:hypothetical protein CLOM_g22031 [Closterium sp. NIES-68]GJP77786.1 hypothetical protein CLOP_g8131 [Closterium sp. NIES-67]
MENRDSSSVRLSLRHGAAVAEVQKHLESFFANLDASLARPVGSALTAARPNTPEPLTPATCQTEAAPMTSDTPSAACERGSLRSGVSSVACVVNVAQSEAGGTFVDVGMRRVKAEAELRSAAELRLQTTVELRASELRRGAGLRIAATETAHRTALAAELRCPRLSELYEVGRELGSGHFGVVRLCEDRATGEQFACKTIMLSDVRRRNDLMELKAEVFSLLRLQEGGGGRLRGAGEAGGTGGKGRFEGAGKAGGRGECGADDAEGDGADLAFVRLYEVLVEPRIALHLILEYCSGGDLFDLVIRQKRLTEAQAAAVFRQLLLAVHAMHQKGIVHRDLKPENILVSRVFSTCTGLCTAAECSCGKIGGTSSSGSSSISQGCSCSNEAFDIGTSSDTSCTGATPPSPLPLTASMVPVSSSARHTSSCNSSNNSKGSSISTPPFQSSSFPSLPPSSPFQLSRASLLPSPSLISPLASPSSFPSLSPAFPPHSPTSLPPLIPDVPLLPPLPPLSSRPPPTHATTATGITSCPCTGIQVKIADFGLAAAFSPGQTAACGVVGSPFYMAPEIIRGRPYAGEVDMWSLGCVLYTCLSGSVPYHGRTHREVFASVLGSAPDFKGQVWEGISREAKQLLRCLLVTDPGRRLKAHEVLKHPWVRGACGGECWGREEDRGKETKKAREDEGMPEGGWKNKNDSKSEKCAAAEGKVCAEVMVCAERGPEEAVSGQHEAGCEVCCTGHQIRRCDTSCTSNDADAAGALSAVGSLGDSESSFEKALELGHVSGMTTTQWSGSRRSKKTTIRDVIAAETGAVSSKEACFFVSRYFQAGGTSDVAGETGTVDCGRSSSTNGGVSGGDSSGSDVTCSDSSSGGSSSGDSSSGDNTSVVTSTSETSSGDSSSGCNSGDSSTNGCSSAGINGRDSTYPSARCTTIDVSQKSTCTSSTRSGNTSCSCCIEVTRLDKRRSSCITTSSSICSGSSRSSSSSCSSRAQHSATLQHGGKWKGRKGLLDVQESSRRGLLSAAAGNAGSSLQVTEKPAVIMEPAAAAATTTMAAAAAARSTGVATSCGVLASASTETSATTNTPFGIVVTALISTPANSRQAGAVAVTAVSSKKSPPVLDACSISDTQNQGATMVVVLMRDHHAPWAQAGNRAQADNLRLGILTSYSAPLCVGGSYRLLPWASPWLHIEVCGTFVPSPACPIGIG